MFSGNLTVIVYYLLPFIITNFNSFFGKFFFFFSLLASNSTRRATLLQVQSLERSPRLSRCDSQSGKC
jgi:hypothetical protein